MAAWVYNSNSGSIVDDYTALLAYPDLHSGTGWHGPFNTKQDALNYYNQNKAQNPGWKAPTGLLPALGNAVTNNPVVNAAGSAVTNALGLPTFENTRSFMVRAVKVIIGLGLVLVGMTMLVKKETNISVGDVAKVAAIA